MYNHWKLATIGMALVLTTALITGVTTAYFTRSTDGRPSSRQHLSRLPRRRLSSPAAPRSRWLGPSPPSPSPPRPLPQRLHRRLHRRGRSRRCPPTAPLVAIARFASRSLARSVASSAPDWAPLVLPSPVAVRRQVRGRSSEAWPVWCSAPATAPIRRRTSAARSLATGARASAPRRFPEEPRTS